jgi:hypothetical protein
VTAILFAALLNLVITGGVGLNRAVLFPGVIGGALGFLLGPTLAWAFMRRVPLGVAILATSIGAGVGAAAGAALALLFPGRAGILALMGGAVLGAGLGALWARRRWSKP